MVLTFDKNNLKTRNKTVLFDHEKIKYWGIYDFSYKYRTRIYDCDDNEVAYVEKDILCDNKAEMFDYMGNKLGEIVTLDNKEKFDKYCYSGDIDEGKAEGLFINDNGRLIIDDNNKTLLVVMFMFGLVEIGRKD